MEAAEYLWDTQLRDVPEEIIRQALQESPKRFPAWIPEVGEFWNLCNEFIQRGKHKWAHEINPGFYRKQPHPEYERQITLGAEIIKRLLKIFPELQQEYENAKGKKVTPNCNYKASAMLAELKKMGRKFFPDDSEEKMLEKIAKWDEQDYRDILQKFKREKKA